APREQVVPPLQESIARLQRAAPKSALVVELECDLGFILTANFNVTEGLTYFEAAFRDNRQRHMPTDVTLLECQSEYGVALMNSDAFQEAERTLRGTLQEQIAMLGDNHASTSDTRYLLGRVLTREGKYAEAASLLRETVESDRNSRPGSLSLMNALAALADALSHLDHLDEAEQLYREVMAMVSVAYPKSALSVGRARFDARFAYILFRNKKIQEAKILVTEALRDLPSNSDEVFILARSYAYAISGIIAKNDGAITEAEESFRQSIALDNAHPGRSPAYYDLAVLLADQGRYSEASPIARDLLKYRQRAMPETAQEFVGAKMLLADIEWHLGYAD
ncbi:MAG TPA: tetratricopeptide repeat protein, partial [Burkholderiaceae bacterium]|nr:tetratricopeptide repeat protein [Burkholderiaceae bacterium]